MNHQSTHERQLHLVPAVIDADYLEELRERIDHDNQEFLTEWRRRHYADWRDAEGSD